MTWNHRHTRSPAHGPSGPENIRLNPLENCSRQQKSMSRRTLRNKSIKSSAKTINLSAAYLDAIRSCKRNNTDTFALWCTVLNYREPFIRIAQRNCAGRRSPVQSRFRSIHDDIHDRRVCKKFKRFDSAQSTLWRKTIFRDEGKLQTYHGCLQYKRGLQKLKA